MKKCLKKTGLAATLFALLFLTACGGGSGSNTTTVSVTLSPSAASVKVDETQTFTVTVVPTSASVAVSAPAAAGCPTALTGGSVACTPTAENAAGYTITVTATASGKTDTKTATLVVEPKPANVEITNKPTGSVDTWSPITLNVTRANTPAFTVEITSSNPGDGISCDTPTADSVTCTPNVAGTYEVTIKASTDNTKTDSVTITATEPDALSVGGAESEDKISMVHVEKTGDGTEADAGFLMGCERTEGEYTNSNCENNAQFPHIVKLTKDFYIGKYEVTLKQWRHVTGGVPGTAVTEFEGVPNDNLPVTRVSYEDVVKFVDGLNNEGEYATTEYLVSGMKWALPTEAQWEYAARGGNKPTNCPNAPNADKWGCLFSGGSFLPNVAWYGATSGGNSGGTIHPVGTVVPIGADPASATPDTTPANSSNELGLYDMSGNVREWVQDWYAVHTIETRIDYAGPDTGSQRVHRGGSYSDSRPTVTVANRSSRNPTSVGQATLGFRLALVPVGTSTATSTPTAKPTFKPTFFESASGTVSGLWDSVVSGVKSLWNSITK